MIVPRWGIQVGVALHQTSPSYAQKEPSRPCPQIPCFESFFMTVKFRLVFLGVPGHLTGLCRCLDQMSLSNGGGLRIESSSSRPPSPSSLLGL